MLVSFNNSIHAALLDTGDLELCIKITAEHNGITQSFKYKVQEK